MNLSIPTEILNNFQNQNVTDLQDTNESNLVFQDIFQDLGSLNQDENLEMENDLINYEFLQGMLNNLEIIDFKEFINLQKDTSVNIEELLKNNESFTKFSSEEVEVLGKLFKLLDEIKLDKNLSIDIKNLQEKFDLIKENIKDLNKNLDVANKSFTSKLDYENVNIKEELYKVESYNQLEVTSLYGKTNMVEKGTISSFTDDEIKTLENILDKGDSNTFTIQNNNLHASNLNNIKDSNLSEVPINSIRKEFISEDVIKTIKYLKSNNIEEINIKITPKELGDMTIKLIKSTEETKVLITISKDDVFNLVNKNTQDIVKHLNELNMKVKEVSVEIKSDNEKFFSDNLNQEFDKKNKENKKKKNSNERIIDKSIDEIKENNRIEENINILI